MVTDAASEPLVVLVRTWMWGPVGARLSTPLTAMIVDLCRAPPALAPVALLLSGDAPQASDEPDTRG